LLADPRFVLEPDFDRLALGAIRQVLGERGGEVFLKASWASGSASGWRGRTESRMAKAAEHLAVSQPVVSKVVADLEQRLGVRLLDRDRHGAQPTVYWLALLKRGVAAFDELRQGVEDIEFLRDPTKGELRIGCTDVVIGGPHRQGHRAGLRAISAHQVLCRFNNTSEVFRLSRITRAQYRAIHRADTSRDRA
jgi:regulatory helix-turn-helix LysR family protein